MGFPENKSQRKKFFIVLMIFSWLRISESIGVPFSSLFFWRTRFETSLNPLFSDEWRYKKEACLIPISYILTLKESKGLWGSKFFILREVCQAQLALETLDMNLYTIFPLKNFLYKFFQSQTKLKKSTPAEMYEQMKTHNRKV